MIRSLVAGFVLAAVVAGCGSGTATAEAPTSRDQALLSSVLRGMKTDLVSVQIAPTSSALAGANRHPGQMLVVKSAATTTAGQLRDDWYAGLIGTAYNDQCAAKADHCLAWYAGPKSVERLGGRYARQPFARRRVLVRKIRAAFASAGLRVTSVSFQHPSALAPVVTVRSSDPQRAVYAIRKVDARMPCCRAAGSFVQMLDGRGSVFYIQAGTWIGSEGWVRPGLRVPGGNQGPTGHQGPTGQISVSGSGRTAWPKPDARDKALLASILHGMRTDLRTVQLTQLPAAWRTERRQGTLQLLTTGPAPGKAHIQSTRAGWDTLLIAHAYTERCFRHADHCVAVYSGPEVGAGGSGRSGAQRPFWSAHALAREIRHRFAAAGLSVTSIAFQHPNALAPIITVRSSHLAHVLREERKAWLALLPALRHTEGSFVEMFGPHGRLLLVKAGSGNTGMGWCARVLKCPGTGVVAGP